MHVLYLKTEITNNPQYALIVLYISLERKGQAEFHLYPAYTFQRGGHESEY